MKKMKGTAIVGAAIAATWGVMIVSAPTASANCGSGGAFGSGGGYCDTYLPNGDIYHCESVYVLGFGGQNCFLIPKGDPRNP